MSNYFQHFPVIKYDGVLVKNISVRTAVLDNIKDDPYAYLPYTLQDDDTPEMVSYHYYGDASYSWLIFLANDIVDPYSQWPMSNENLEKTIANKYRANAQKAYSLDYANDKKVIQWTSDATRTDNIVYYKYIGTADDVINHTINRDTWLYTPGIVQGDYVPVRIYDNEFEKNEANRNINLINVTYLDTCVMNLKKALTGK